MLKKGFGIQRMTAIKGITEKRPQKEKKNNFQTGLGAVPSYIGSAGS